MDSSSLNLNKIISRLQLFSYNYSLNGNILIVYFPLLCFLKINFENKRIKITSHLRGLGIGLRIEIDYLLYFFIFYFIFYLLGKSGQLSSLSECMTVLVLWFMFIIYLVICFIKMEVMKLIIHNWIEKDALN